jgi:hypothetical protein
MSAYDAGGFWHFVTFGLTELFAKESEDPAQSGFGYELTFKVPKRSGEPPDWAFQLLDAIGRNVWRGVHLGVGHTLRTGPLDRRPATPQTAILVVRDPAFPTPLATPHGAVELRLLVGVDDLVRQRVVAAHHAAGGAPGWEVAVVRELQAADPALVTPIRTLGAWTKS